MQRPLVHAGLWAAATWAAVMLSWFGVSAVLKGTVYDPPQALSVSDGPDWAEAGARLPDASSTQRPRPDDAGATDRPDPSDAMGGGHEGHAAAGTDGSTALSPAPGQGDPGAEAGGTPDPAGEPARDDGRDRPAPEDSGSGESGSGDAGYGTVETVVTDGGRVVLDLREDHAELVSASPQAGWEMQVWNEETWIRVTFSRDDRALSVFCVWNGHPPLIEHYED
ncbi:hypothetical protein [Streptomyces aidingensis]